MEDEQLTRPERTRAITGLVAIVVAGVLSLLGVLLIVAAVTEDAAIERHTGNANADVVSVSFNRTLVRFQTPDGAEHLPTVGVLYPEALEEGQVVRVEYDLRNPDLVRVAGRGASLTILPVSTALIGVWAIAGGALFWLRRGGPLHIRRLRPRRRVRI
ncbi:DUF3592 domain-containing protein [Actinokineospora sp. NBRC 105648]|uniref:DUF3592 domain-containing protein n=1 Tax=Actinokineospora sp. NBRC 105648 TaxID=3032206 RepID=UPI0024A5C412|nr:DUF3592 domain-containing protein [Actinokineospora sp. NBRC 105648]GLZ38173.1 hypothetical protein Acsp05_17970 [Actinokineospora sp. NBRC 105648]